MGHLSWLFDKFAASPDRTFMLWQDGPYTYGWLLEQTGQRSEDVRSQGIHAGSIVAVQGDYSPFSVAVLLALIDTGVIVVPLSPAIAGQESEFLGIAEVQFAAVLESGKITYKQRPAGLSQNPLYGKLKDRGHPGLVLFSSGSTGKSKAALHDLSPLLEKFKQPRRAMITMAFLMIDHIGGLNTLFYVLSNAGTAVTSSSRDPDTICATMARHRVELLPTSPTFLNLLLLSEAYLHHDLSSLRLITYGTEMMPRRTLHRIAEAFPNATLQQTYGLSEVGILRSRSEDSHSLWVRVGGEGYQTKVQSGTLWIKAESAMLGYLNAASPFDEEGWLDTGDLVEVRGDYFTFLGRKSEVINVGGQKVHPAELENTLLSLSNVRDVTVTGEPNLITGQIVVAHFNLVEPEESTLFKKRVREFCRGRVEPFKIPARIEIVDRDQFSARFKKMRNLTDGGAVGAADAEAHAKAAASN